MCINIATEGYTEVDKTTEALRREKGITVEYETIDRNPYIEDAFSAYETPFRIHDIPTLAKELTTKFNILKLHNVSKNKYSISSLYTNGDATCNILYYNNHFYYINDLDKLITFVTKRRRDKKEICVNCLHYFDKRYISLEKHQSQCKIGKGSITRYPKEGQAKEHTQYNFNVKSPFMLVADLEATNSENDKIAATPSTNVKRIHRINSYAVFLHIDPDLDNFPYDDFPERIIQRYVYDNSEEAERALIAQFMQDVYNFADRLTTWQQHIDQESQLRNLKKKHLLEYTIDNICIYCGEETTDSKVLDHDHCRNVYNGPAHSRCNLRARKQKEIPLFFHNATYDVNLIMKYIGSNEMYGDEEYWKISMVGQRVKFVCSEIISIKDSYALLPMALSELGRQLSEADCIYQRLHGARISGNWGKGIYPYEWMDDVAKMDDKNFPPIEAFENQMGNRVFEEDYERARGFFTLHCNTFRDYHDYYLRQDVLVLADALIKFRNDLYSLLKMDLLRTYSLPQYSFAAFLSLSKVKIPYITDPTMYNIAEAATKGGLNIVAKRVTEIYDHEKERIIYMDMM